MTEGGLDLANFPQAVANAFGTSLLGGQLIASAFVLMVMLLPTLLLTRKNPLIAVIVGILALGIDVALTWLPAWIFLITIIMIAALLSGLMRDWLSGRGGGS